jgi:C4-dicarboxylate transporter
MKQLKKLMNTTIETIIEGMEHQPWTAFINNTIAFGGVMMNNQELVQDIREAKKNLSILSDLENEAMQNFGNKQSAQIVAIVFKHVWAAVVYNVGTVDAIIEDIAEYHRGKEPMKG